jgi:hypothetical protein
VTPIDCKPSSPSAKCSDFQWRIPGSVPEEAPLFDSFLEILPEATDGCLGSLRLSERTQRELAGLDGQLLSLASAQGCLTRKRRQTMTTGSTSS